MTDTTATQVDTIVKSAADAAPSWAHTSRPDRAAALRGVADKLDAAGDQLVPLAMQESHLPEARLRGELARTTFQLRLLGETIEDGEYLDARIDHADADWPMGARPDLRRTRVPVGPTVVFAASNFPFAFSVIGGDSASALAAGCPVILKAHPGHPELSAATAAVVREALAEAGAADGVFQIIYGQDAGVAALQHPLVKAAAFTGSIPGGRALFDIATARPEPIPFYGELGSINPVFVTKGADDRRGGEIADGLVQSFTMGVGQFCTKPGLVFAPAGSTLLQTMTSAELPGAAPMLNDRISGGYVAGQQGLRDHGDVRVVNEGTDALADPPAPTVLATTLDAVLSDPDALMTECFGPTVLVAEYDDEARLTEAAQALDGQLTATLAAEEDDAVVNGLADVLATKAGRVLWNQWPTGVSVTYAMQHGGPYPATTAPGTTSVGTAAIDRFTRPVAFQGFPTDLLPGELRDDSQTPRRVDGQRV